MYRKKFKFPKDRRRYKYYDNDGNSYYIKILNKKKYKLYKPNANLLKPGALIIQYGEQYFTSKKIILFLGANFSYGHRFAPDNTGGITLTIELYDLEFEDVRYIMSQDTLYNSYYKEALSKGKQEVQELIANIMFEDGWDVVSK